MQHFVMMEGYFHNNSFFIVSPNGIYRWERNGVQVIGETARNITLDDWTESGDYTVTIFGNTINACPNESDPYPVLIDPPPIATVGVNQSFCGNISTVATLSGNNGGNDLNNGATGLWSFQSIWKENFNDLSDGTTIDAGATSWSRVISNTVGGWYSRVTSQRYILTGNRTVWTSGTINIGAYSDVGVSVDLSSMTTGGFENTDYIYVRYIVDGVPDNISGRAQVQ